MKLLFYSGGQTSQNKVLHATLADLVGAKRNKSFCYLPFCFDRSALFFERAKKRYRAHGFTQFNFLAADQIVSADALKKALNSDVVYLAGGNTFYFLWHLKKSGIFGKLRRYVQEGGVLAGLSAGAIIMTPTIESAAFPEDLADENEVGLKNLKGLNLVPFEFFPHFDKTLYLRTRLREYSLGQKGSIFACPDGSGLVLKNGSLKIIGKATLFEQGIEIGL